MLSLFYKLRTGKRGQLATFLIFVLVIFLIFAFVSVNLGKLALNRTKTANGADAAALAAGSAASQLLNYMAGYNELMLLNLAGFTTQAMLLVVQWVIDFVYVIIYTIQTFVSHVAGPGGVVASGAMLLSCLISIDCTMAAIALLIEGATETAEYFKEAINELNPKLPKTTRNVGRQYAFMNAGINEPKEEYDDWLVSKGLSDSDAVWQQYLDEESTFGAFMRTLVDTNKSDGDFLDGNKLSFSWGDERRTPEMTGVDSSGKVQTGQRTRRVTNQLDVSTWPMRPLILNEVNFGDISTDSGLRDEVIDAINDAPVSGFYGAWIKLGITLSPGIVVMFALIKALMIIYNVVLAILIVVAIILEAVYDACSIYFCACCVQLAGVIALVALFGAIMAFSFNLDPTGIPCFMYGEDTNDLTTDIEIKRITAPIDSLDYGLWNMQYPTVTSYSEVFLDGSGGPKLFPPVQDYWPRVLQAR